MCHQASLTGAPKSLFNIGKILSSLGYEIITIINTNGPLKKDFNTLGECFLWNKYDMSTASIFLKILNKIYNLNNLNRKRIIKNIKNQKNIICLNNTVANYEIVKYFKKIKIISWIHELSYMIRALEINGCNPESLLKESDFILTASKAVGNNLNKKFFLDNSKIYTLYEIIDIEPVKAIKKKNNDFLTVGGCGSLGWRKGTDLFLKTAKYLKDCGEIDNFKFIWKGGCSNEISFLEFQQEILNLGLSRYVKIIASDNRIAEFYQSIDIFLLCSREDPFPLVSIEAGIFGKPIIGFLNSGGIEELLSDKAGILVPYADYKSLAKEILMLDKNSSHYKFLSTKISQKSKDFTISSKKTEVSALFNNFFKSLPKN